MPKNTQDNENFIFKNTKGIEYELVFRKPNKATYGEDCDGICYDPKEKEPKILISPYLTKQSELNTIVHEMAHAFFWDKPETDILAFANAVSRMLYNHCQWRKLEDEKEKRN
jgi:hypothetical protein